MRKLAFIALSVAGLGLALSGCTSRYYDDRYGYYGHRDMTMPTAGITTGIATASPTAMIATATMTACPITPIAVPTIPTATSGS